MRIEWKLTLGRLSWLWIGFWVRVHSMRHGARQSVVYIACLSCELKQFLADNAIATDLLVTSNIVPFWSTGKHLAAWFSGVWIRFTGGPVNVDQGRVIGPVEIVGGWIPIQCDPKCSVYGWGLFLHEVEEKPEFFSVVDFCQVSTKALTERLGLAPAFA